MPLGTAPRRKAPGIWVTRKGRQLTPAEAAAWEKYHREGLTDGNGHFADHAKADYHRHAVAAPTANPERDLEHLGFEGASQVAIARKKRELAQPAKPDLETTKKLALARGRVLHDAVRPSSDPFGYTARSRSQESAFQHAKPAEPDFLDNFISGTARATYDLLRAASKQAQTGRLVDPDPESATNKVLREEYFPATADLIQGKGASPWAAAELAGVFPLGKLFRPILVREAERAGEVAARGGGEYQARLLRHNEATAQLQKPRSLLAQAGLMAIDKAGRAIEKLPGVKDEQGVRTVFLPATNVGKVTKYLGRGQRVEKSRAQGNVALHVKEIEKIKAGSPDDVANFWYAQLPSTHYNAEGLRLIQNGQKNELQYLTSGQALRDLEQREAAIRAEIGSMQRQGSELDRAYRDYVRDDPVAPDRLTREEFAARHPELSADPPPAVEPGQGKSVPALLGDLEKVRLQMSDIPHDIDGLKVSIAQLEDLATNPPAPNQKAIDAVRALGGEGERILVNAGRLKPERAAERRGLVSRWAGLEPSGEEAYLGHRLPPSDARGYPPTQVSGGTGRVASPRGVGSENRLVLARRGRIRASTHVAIEDWQTRQVFEQANAARADLGGLGDKYTGRVPKGHVLVNPKGKTVPAHWRGEELAQFADSYDDIDALRAHAEEVARTFVAETPEEIEALKASALEQGVSLDDLRVVPKRLVDRYYAQFRRMSRPGKYGKAYDALVDAMVVSVVFARIGYIPKNLVQNLIMALPHQGPMVLVNAVKAAQAWKDPELRALIRAEIGDSGPTGALREEGATAMVENKIVRGVIQSADEPMRFAAWLHEAGAEGVISRYRPMLNEQDRERLLAFLKSKDNVSNRRKLNDVSSRMREAMADFTRLTPDQAKAARRILIIPGWLVAGTRYPFHFAATHPIRSALLAYIAMGEPGAPEQLRFNRSIDEYFVEDALPYLEGIDTPWGRERTNSLSPVSTPWENLQAIRGKSPDSALGVANPLGLGLALTAGRVVKMPDGSFRKVGLEEAAETNLLQRLSPNYGLARDLSHPGESKVYDEKTPLDRIKREVGILPVRVNREHELELTQARKPLAERREQKLADHAKAVGAPEPPAEVREDLKWATKLDQEIKRGQTWEERFRIAAKLYDERNGTKLSSLKTVNEAQAEELYHRIYAAIAPVYRQWQSRVEKVYKRSQAAQKTE